MKNGRPDGSYFGTISKVHQTNPELASQKFFASRLPEFCIIMHKIFVTLFSGDFLKFYAKLFRDFHPRFFEGMHNISKYSTWNSNSKKESSRRRMEHL